MTKKAFIFVAFMLISFVVSARVNYAMSANACLPDDTTKVVGKKMQMATSLSHKDTLVDKKKFIGKKNIFIGNGCSILNGARMETVSQWEKQCYKYL